MKAIVGGMKILVVTPELAPFGLADSNHDRTAVGLWSEQLAHGLLGLEHKVHVFTPFYQHMDSAQHALARRLKGMEITWKGETHPCHLYDGRTPSGITVSFCEISELVKGADAETTRELGFAKFCLAAREFMKRGDSDWDVVHTQGALCAQLAKVLGKEQPRTASLITCGLQPSDVKELQRASGSDLAGSILSTECLAYADAVTTCSFAGRKDVLECIRSSSFEGQDETVSPLVRVIPFGIDYAVWNPATDSHLDVRYDAALSDTSDTWGKASCKAALQRQTALPIRHDVPMITAVAPERIENFTEILRSSLDSDVQWTLVVDASSPSNDTLEGLRERWPDRLGLVREANDSTEHALLGASDFWLITDVQTECGTDAQRALRYGSLPICPDTGPYADLVVDCDAALETGNGFLYDGRAMAETLLVAIQKAVSLYAHAQFPQRRLIAMRGDYSWDRSARRFEALFQSLVGRAAA